MEHEGKVVRHVIRVDVGTSSRVPPAPGLRSRAAELGPDPSPRATNGTAAGTGRSGPPRPEISGRRAPLIAVGARRPHL